MLQSLPLVLGCSLRYLSKLHFLSMISAIFFLTWNSVALTDSSMVLALLLLLLRSFSGWRTQDDGSPPLPLPCAPLPMVLECLAILVLREASIASMVRL